MLASARETPGLPAATLKPIPDSTWLRLAALEPRCNISMWRDQPWLVHGSGGRMVWGVGGPPAPTRRVWRVRVFLRGSARTHDIIDADEPHLADGLERAIAEAERRGWHQPGAPHAARAAVSGPQTSLTPTVNSGSLGATHA